MSANRAGASAPSLNPASHSEMRVLGAYALLLTPRQQLYRYQRDSRSDWRRQKMFWEPSPGLPDRQQDARRLRQRLTNFKLDSQHACVQILPHNYQPLFLGGGEGMGALELCR